MLVLAATLVLTGCAVQGGTGAAEIDPKVAAYIACQQLATPLFDLPESVEWPGNSESTAKDGDEYTVTVTTSNKTESGDSGHTNVVCVVSKDASGVWSLSSYTLQAR